MLRPWTCPTPPLNYLELRSSAPPLLTRRSRMAPAVPLPPRPRRCSPHQPWRRSPSWRPARRAPRAATLERPRSRWCRRLRPPALRQVRQLRRGPLPGLRPPARLRRPTDRRGASEGVPENPRRLAPGRPDGQRPSERPRPKGRRGRRARRETSRGARPGHPTLARRNLPEPGKGTRPNRLRGNLPPSSAPDPPREETERRGLPSI